MLAQMIVFSSIFLIFYGVIFLIGVLLTRWLAKLQEYSESWIPAIIMNLLYFGTTIGIGILLYLIFDMEALLQIHFIFALPLNILLGIMISQHALVYDIDNYKDAFKFVILNLILLFVLLIIAFFVSIFLFVIITF